MKQFIYKTIIVIIAIVVLYEFTVSKQIKQITEQSEKDIINLDYHKLIWVKVVVAH